MIRIFGIWRSTRGEGRGWEGRGDERRRRGGPRWVVNRHYGDECVRSRLSAESCNKLNNNLQKNIGCFENKNGI